MHNLDALDSTRNHWIADSGMYAKWTRLWKQYELEGLSNQLPCTKFDRDYPISREPGYFKPTFSDFNCSVTYRFNRDCWPIIPIPYLFKIPQTEFKCRAFYITFIDLTPLTEPNTPLRELRFVFWTDLSKALFHDMIHFESDFHPDLNICNLFGSYVFAIEYPQIFKIQSSLAYYILNYCNNVGEEIPLLL